MVRIYEGSHEMGIDSIRLVYAEIESPRRGFELSCGNDTSPAGQADRALYRAALRMKPRNIGVDMDIKRGGAAWQSVRAITIRHRPRRGSERFWTRPGGPEDAIPPHADKSPSSPGAFRSPGEANLERATGTFA